jgi:alpha-L-fucosidase 2
MRKNQADSVQICLYSKPYNILYEADNSKQSLNTALQKSTSPNMFGLHPPFQMDANFGVTAGIAEMLIQSHVGIISLLPAFPKEWQGGEVVGLLAPGGFEVSINWIENQMTGVQVLSKLGNALILKYGNAHFELEKTQPNTVYVFDENLNLLN